MASPYTAGVTAGAMTTAALAGDASDLAGKWFECFECYKHWV